MSLESELILIFQSQRELMRALHVETSRAVSLASQIVSKLDILHDDCQSFGDLVIRCLEITRKVGALQDELCSIVSHEIPKTPAQEGKHQWIIQQNAFDRWVIADALNPELAWSDSGWIDVRPDGLSLSVKISNFETFEEAEKYAAEKIGGEGGKFIEPKRG